MLYLFQTEQNSTNRNARTPLRQRRPLLLIGPAETHTETHSFQPATLARRMDSEMSFNSILDLDCGTHSCCTLANEKYQIYKLISRDMIVTMRRKSINILSQWNVFNSNVLLLELFSDVFRWGSIHGSQVAYRWFGGPWHEIFWASKTQKHFSFFRCYKMSSNSLTVCWTKCQ